MANKRTVCSAYAVALGPHAGAMDASRWHAATMTLEALAARKGRVLVVPSLVVTEQDRDGMRRVFVRAQTAPKPHWRRKN
jgi:hypothetical protein